MNPPHLTSLRSILAASALVLAGFGGGALLALNGTADAATGSGASSPSGSDGHAGETPLSGTTAAKVKAAVLAKYPGATVERLETDSDGVYEAHITTKAGKHVVVEVGKDFAVTGTEAFGRFGHDGPRGFGDHGHGDHDGDRPDTTPSR